MNRRGFLSLAALLPMLNLPAAVAAAPVAASAAPPALIFLPAVLGGLKIHVDHYCPPGSFWAFGGTGFTAEECAGLSDVAAFALMVERGATVVAAPDIMARLAAAVGAP